MQKATFSLVSLMLLAMAIGSTALFNQSASAFRCTRDDGTQFEAPSAAACDSNFNGGAGAGNPGSPSSLNPSPALPSIESSGVPCGSYDTDSILGIPVWYKYLEGQKELTIYEGQTSEGNCLPVLDEPADALPIGLAVIEAAMVIAGFVAVVMIFVGSFGFITSQGQGDKAASARKTVINAAIGMVIVLVAARVVSFIAGRIT